MTRRPLPPAGAALSARAPALVPTTVRMAVVTVATVIAGLAVACSPPERPEGAVAPAPAGDAGHPPAGSPAGVEPAPSPAGPGAGVNGPGSAATGGEAPTENSAATESEAATGTTVDLWATVEPDHDGTRLAVVVDHGGGCAGGPCRRMLDLAIDGRWRLSDQSGVMLAGGAYDAATLAQLTTEALERGDTLSLGPFEGECPTATGRSERFYRLHRPDDPTTVAVELSTCADLVDADARLIVVLDLLMVDAEREAAPSTGVRDAAGR